MIVCVCNAVSDRTVRTAVRRGAASLTDLMVDCDAGTGCGACHPELEALLARADAVTAAEAARRPLADARPPSRS